MIKLTRVIEYFNYLVEEHALLLQPKSLKLASNADASYAEHGDGRSQTGGTIGFEGYGPLLSGWYFIFLSCIQQMIAKSSIRAELYSNSTVGESLLWARETLFLLGFSVEISVMQKDNISTKLNTERGFWSFKRSKHIKVRYYWLKQLIDVGELVLEYVPSLEMVADLLTKPVVGAVFWKHLENMLGWNWWSGNNCKHSEGV
jgi:hypothetical protein